MVYVIVAFGVPVKVTVADVPEQIVWSAEIDAVGTGKILIVTVEDTAAHTPVTE